jgi:hypothetical protein
MSLAVTLTALPSMSLLPVAPFLLPPFYFPDRRYDFAVSASEIIKQLPKLNEAQRRAVLNKLRELAVRDEDVRLCEQAADEQAAELDRLEEPPANYRAVDLSSRGISEAQARDLRARLKTFAEDWDRPEAAIYDEPPAR